jgi:hypothetical protein
MLKRTYFKKEESHMPGKEYIMAKGERKALREIYNIALDLMVKAINRKKVDSVSLG